MEDLTAKLMGFILDELAVFRDALGKFVPYIKCAPRGKPPT